MFTGLVQAVGRVVSARPGPTGVMRLVIDTRDWPHRPSAGDSIAVDGCCLTVVTPPEGTRLSFDVVPQTLSLTTLGGFAEGRRVNLEHAATATTLLGGHVVQGHVDGVAEVVRVQTGGDWRVTLRVPDGLSPFMIGRGSVCLSGVSLTLAEVSGEGHEITVALIPTTLAITNLGELRVGQGVNLEADALTKTVVQTVNRVMEGRR